MDNVSKKWYYDVHDHCAKLSEKYNVPLIKVASIMSVLSPQVTFVQNITSLENYLETGGDCTVSTFGKQKIKADNIYALDNPTEDDVKIIIGKGLKTLSFFENIYRPSTSKAVTVDLWQVRWAKMLGLVPQDGALTVKRYRIISEYIVKKANELNIMPHEYQAVTWVEIRGKAF